MVDFLRQMRVWRGMITFVMMEPKTSGNVGAVARVLKNFGFSRLVLINPKCNVKDKEALDRAKHAKEVLQKAVIAKPSILSSFHTVIATTSKLGSDYNIPRTPVTPRQLCAMLPKQAYLLNKSFDIAILIGREGDGLTNDEILAADMVLAIPSDPVYPALNVSHAAGIIAYELSSRMAAIKVHDHIALASQLEIRQMMKMMNRVINSVHFTTQEKKETQQKVWKRLFSKSFLSRREAFAVMGLLRKLVRRR